MNNPYILPKNIKPISYDINFTLDMNKLSFSGEETIKLRVIKPTKEIKINADGIKITSAGTNGNEFSGIKYEKEVVAVTFKNQIKTDINLFLKFNGKLREDMRGFYKSNYNVNGKEKIMATTQFEPSDARKAFPCFDEPNLKAKFKITFNIPKELAAVSNMPIKEEKVNRDIKTVKFEESPIMSTYLVAFIIGELEYLETKTKDSVKIRVYTTPGKKDQGKFALETAVKALNFYNYYFGIPYPLPKLDMIAIPDFDAGAMENWGIITYRETALLFDEKNSSVANKQRVAVVVAHEIAHQWFGNLVTMDWWNDLWLNEGFASWIEYKAVDSIFPEWEMWNQFLFEDFATALYLDALETSHAIEVEVKNPAEINEIFDTVSYSKGASIIRMLEHYTGENVFKMGLQHYIKEHSYKNTKTDDLWKSLETVSKKPIKKIMDCWTKQTGFPFISVSKNGSKLQLKQERFFYTDKKDKTLWHIPIAMNQNGKLNYYDMKEKELELNHDGLPNINSSQAGYFIVKYEKELLKKIVNDVNKLSPLDRFGLQNNTFMLAKACKVPVIDFLDLSLAYKKESDFTIFMDISSSLSEIGGLFYDTEFKKNYEKLVHELFYNTYKNLGWEENKKEKHTDLLLRNLVITKLGLNGDKEIIQEARKRFKEHLNGKKINPNIRGSVYVVVAKNGDKEVYDSLVKLYMESDLQQEKVRILSALGMFKQPELIKNSLKFGLSRNVRPQDILFTFSSVSGNPESNGMGWEFLKDNWKELFKRYSESKIMNRIINFTTNSFKTFDKEKEVENFFKKNPVPIAKRTIQQSLETIRINKNLFEKNKNALESWRFN